MFPGTSEAKVPGGNYVISPVGFGNVFLMGWARDLSLGKAVEIPEYFVYFGVFTVHNRRQRSDQTAKGTFSEATINQRFPAADRGSRCHRWRSTSQRTHRMPRWA